jgi:uncharacterized damage-inducible protein DinB
MKLLNSVVVCLVVSSVAFAADDPKAASKYGAEFAKHWSTARDLTLAVAEAMPAENYDFKPNPEEMSFGEQIVHIGQANYSYCTRMTGATAKSPFVKPEKIDKATALKVVGDAFSYCGEIVSKLTDDQLGEVRGPMDVRELTLGVMTHMAHHRGQAEVYLRVKGIKPPTYKF